MKKGKRENKSMEREESDDEDVDLDDDLCDTADPLPFHGPKGGRSPPLPSPPSTPTPTPTPPLQLLASCCHQPTMRLRSSYLLLHRCPSWTPHLTPLGRQRRRGQRSGRLMTHRLQRCRRLPPPPQRKVRQPRRKNLLSLSTFAQR